MMFDSSSSTMAESHPLSGGHPKPANPSPGPAIPGKTASWRTAAAASRLTLWIRKRGGWASRGRLSSSCGSRTGWGGPGAQGPDESKAVEGHVRLRSGQLARWRSSFYETGPRYLPRRPVGVSGGDGGESGYT